MRQIWISKKGAPDVLNLREVEEPTAGDGELKVRVTGAGVNFADNLMRMGLYPGAPKPPMVPGLEFAGVVDRIGSGVAGFAEGDRVMGFSERLGAYSEYVAVPAQTVVKVPEHLNDTQAAAIPVNYITAYMMLVRLANLQSGDRVLIHAAAGGVGVAAVQICKWKGAKAMGTASAAKHARLKELGCSDCIDYRSQDFEQEIERLTGGKGVDVVLDSVGGGSFRKSYRCLAPMGRLVLFGASSMAPGKKANPFAAIGAMLRMPSFKPMDMMSNNKSVMSFWLGKPGMDRNRIMADFGEIARLTRERVFDPIVDKTFKFEEAAAAHHYMQDRKNFGKIVLTP